MRPSDVPRTYRDVPDVATAAIRAPARPGTATDGSARSPRSEVNARLPPAVIRKAISRYSSTPTESPGAGSPWPPEEVAVWRPTTVAEGFWKSG